MDLTEDQKIEKYVKKRMHCTRNTLLPYEYEYTCFTCGYNVIKWKNELSKISRKKLNFMNRSKYAQHKTFCLWMNVYKSWEGVDFNGIFEVSSRLKTKN